MAKNKDKTGKDGGKLVKSTYIKEVGKQEKSIVRFLNYTPLNDAEEKDLLLASIINDAEDLLLKWEMKADAAQRELRLLELEREIHQAIMSDKAADKNWEYRFSEDEYFDIRRRAEEIREEIAYREQYIVNAKKLIKGDKYKNVPPDFWRSYHWDSEGVNIWDDDDDDESVDFPF